MPRNEKIDFDEEFAPKPGQEIRRSYYFTAPPNPEEDAIASDLLDHARCNTADQVRSAMREIRHAKGAIGIHVQAGVIALSGITEEDLRFDPVAEVLPESPAVSAQGSNSSVYLEQSEQLMKV